jgi:hypothetical protein
VQHQEILFGRAGQAFRYDPPDGRPAATPVPTVHVSDGDHGVSATTGTCTIDEVDTVLYGDAVSGSRSIRVASVAGIVAGGRYLMTKPNREREWLDVVGVRAGDNTVLLRHPLIHRYAGAATIVGCRISIAVDPKWVEQQAMLTDRPGRGGFAGYRLRWTYTFDGFEHVGISYADLVGCRSTDLVTPADLQRQYPGWTSEPLGPDYIAEAVRAVRLEAIGDDHAQRRIRDTTVLRELVKTRAQIIRLEQGVLYGAPRTAELEVAEKRYRSQYAKLVEVPKLAAPAPVAAPPPPQPKLAKGTLPDGPRRRVPKLTNQ